MIEKPDQEDKSEQVEEEYAAPLAAAPVEPIPIQVENPDMEVAEGEQVAAGWTPWFAPEEDNAQPELYGAEVESSDGRQRRVQGIRSTERYDVAFYQHVEVEPGLALTFNMTLRSEPHDSNLRRPKGLVGGVGIDPTGGADARAFSVQWALTDYYYFEDAPATVTAIARNDRVTVFVRSVAFIPGSNSTATNGSAQVCARICVRTAFPRTFLLLPASAPSATWQRAAKTARRLGWTMGASADDAGIGSGVLNPLPIVKVINPGSIGNGLTAAWYQANYPPGVNFQIITENDLDP